MDFLSLVEKKRKGMNSTGPKPAQYSPCPGETRRARTLLDLHIGPDGLDNWLRALHPISLCH
jgi:hypothetical protein